MRSTIGNLAKMAEEPGPAFTAFDPKSLPLPPDQSVHPTVADYFATCIPTESLGVWVHTLLSPADLVDANEDHELADEICRSGFVIFGRTYSGDFMAVDVVSGKCIELATFASYESDGDLRAQLFENAYRQYGSLPKFFVTLRREFAVQLEKDKGKDRAFRKASKADPNAKGPDGHTLLAIRILEEDLDGVRREVERGARIVPLSPDEDNPIEDAITMCDSTAILAYLIEQGAPVEPQSLVWAADAMAYDHLDLLLAAGANPESLPAKDHEQLMRDEDVVERFERFFGS